MWQQGGRRGRLARRKMKYKFGVGAIYRKAGHNKLCPYKNGMNSNIEINT
jgi:hypothetical protein